MLQRHPQTNGAAQSPSAAPRRKRLATHLSPKQRSGKANIEKILFLIITVWAAACFFFLSENVSDDDAALNKVLLKKDGDTIASDAALRRTQQLDKKKKRKESIILRPASSIDAVANALLNLVRLSSMELRYIFENDEWKGNFEKKNFKKKDPFRLADLERGECPFAETMTLDWLPPSLSSDASTLFRHRNDNDNNNNSDAKKRKVAIWYEHLSKAGGTSMCNLANSNMAKSEVPNYYCMPSEPKKIDARVGQWDNNKLKLYIDQNKKYIVSNEWEPFPLERLAMRPDAAAAAENHNDDDDPWLIFVTTIRHPLNRIISAWKFWGQLHFKGEVKPTLAQFIQRREDGARRDFNKPQGLGKGGIKNAGDNFLAMVGRPNFALWKFSGGTMPLPMGNENGLVPWGDIESEWLDSFVTAVKTLCQFDLMIPMELLSTTHETTKDMGVGPLHDVLGWNHFEKSHVVPSGSVVNNNAKESDLTSDQYDVLWDKNRLDMVIYYWSRAVYLTKIHCADSLVVGV